MSGKPPYFPLYVNDFAASSKVEAMTTEAVGAYLLLLLKAWHQDPPGSIPADDDVLARWARLAPDRWAAIKPTVLAAFTSGSDGRYHQLRMRDEYRKLMALFQARSRAGKKTAAKRWSKKKSGPRSSATSSATAELVAPDSESDSDSGSESPGRRGEAGGGGGRPRDPLWDEVCVCFSLSPQTKTERSRVGKIVRDLRAKGAAPADVAVRLGRYRREWPNAADTPEALLKHWDRFAAEPRPHAAPPNGRPGPCSGPEEWLRRSRENGLA